MNSYYLRLKQTLENESFSYPDMSSVSSIGLDGYSVISVSMVRVLYPETGDSPEPVPVLLSSLPCSGDQLPQDSGIIAILSSDEPSIHGVGGPIVLQIGLRPGGQPAACSLDRWLWDPLDTAKLP